MKKVINIKKILVLLVALAATLCLVFASGCGGKSKDTTTAVQTSESQTEETGDNLEDETETFETIDPDDEASGQITEDGEYSTLEQVSVYIHLYGHLPENYITKSEAKSYGWVSKEGNLWDVCPGKSIGGDVYKNYEKQLPEKKGRTYYECDVNYEGGFRGDDRIIYSNDGLVYYTSDHYENFMLLFGDPGN